MPTIAPISTKPKPCAARNGFGEMYRCVDRVAVIVGI
jgi:hypothetical protein